MNLSFNPDFLLFSSELLWKLFKLKSDLFMGVAQQCSVSTVASQQEGGPDGTFLFGVYRSPRAFVGSLQIICLPPTRQLLPVIVRMGTRFTIYRYKLVRVSYIPFIIK